MSVWLFKETGNICYRCYFFDGVHTSIIVFRTTSDEDSTSELSDNYQSEESNSSGDRRAKRRITTKWAPRASSSDAEDSSHSVQKTAAGRYYHFF